MKKPCLSDPRPFGRRRYLTLFLTIAAFAVSNGGNASTASALPPEFWGIMSGGNRERTSQEMDAIKRSGVSFIRMDISWCLLGNRHVTNPGEEWRPYEEVFQLAYERGLYVLPDIYGNLNCSTEHQFPTEAEWSPRGSGWETFLYEAVQRFGFAGSFWAGKPNPRPVGVWEIWNEENLAANNPGGQRVSPENFARFLLRSSQAIHAAEKGGRPQVLMGGLFSAANNGQSSMSAPLYIEAVNKVANATASYDALSLHPYAFTDNAGKAPSNSGEVTQVAEKVMENIRAARGALQKIGASKPIWITELGWPLSNGEGANFPWVSEAIQAEEVTQTFSRIKNQAETLGVARLVSYDDRDLFRESDWPTTGWSWRCGLRSLNGKFRPAWYAFQQQTGALRWPAVEWHNEDLSGGFLSSPDISSWEPGRIDIFGRGTNNYLHHKWSIPGQLSTWENMGGNTISSGPGAVSWGRNRIDLVVRANDGSVEHRWYDGSSWQSENLGGQIVGDPDISSWGYGRLDIFALGTNNYLHHKWYTPQTGWSAWENMGGNTVSSAPGAVSGYGNRIDLVVRANDGSVEHRWYDGSWHSENLGGQIVGDPDIASWEPERVDVFARGTDNLLHQDSFNIEAWSGWQNVPGPSLLSSPGAVSWGVNRIDVVGRSSNGSMTHWWFE